VSRFQRSPFGASALALAASLTLAGCAVGPDFHTPAAPTDRAYTPQPIVSTAAPEAPVAGGAQAFSSTTPLPAEWWHQFNSPALDKLVAEALARNSDLAAARAALKAARETYLASRGVLFPSVDATASTSRNKGTQYLAPALADNSFSYNLQTAQVSVGYALDLFGGNRRQIEQTLAQYQAQRFETEAARITLITNVVATAVSEASLRRQVAAQERIVAVVGEQVAIARRQQAQGEIAGAAVMAQEAALAQARAALPPLRKQWTQAQDALAYLTGHSPAERAPAAIDLAVVSLPHDLPVSLPADLVRRRPDVRAAEESLHAASAGVGVAIAARLPQITLSASSGGSSSNWSNLLSASNSFWSFGAGVAQPVFAGGTLLHRQRAAKAQFEQARNLYRSVVLTAFQNVADTLHALQLDADALDAAEVGRRAAGGQWQVAQRQYRLGEISYPTMLIAEQSLRQAEQTLDQAAAQRIADTAALFQALGGGS
jgi:NodT family efflux transporter outer membrane factor (OMF) lipoprotein